MVATIIFYWIGKKLMGVCKNLTCLGDTVLMLEERSAKKAVFQSHSSSACFSPNKNKKGLLCLLYPNY